MTLSGTHDSFSAGWPRWEIPRLDLVAVAYQAPDETSRFLQSLIDHIDVPFTLTVIENHSPDDAVREVLKAGVNAVAAHDLFCGGNLFFEEENLGYARACNKGAAFGQASILALLNCDIQWKPGVGTAVLNAFDHHEEAGIIGPKTVTSTTSPLHRPKLTHSGIVHEPLTGRDMHRFWMSPDIGQADDILTGLRTVSGATYFVRRTCWDQLTACSLYRECAPEAQGAFLPTQHYYEETFCSYHARAHGWDVVYRGDICMVHEWHKSSLVGGAQDRLFKESEEYFRTACRTHGIELTW